MRSSIINQNVTAMLCGSQDELCESFMCLHLQHNDVFFFLLVFTEMRMNLIHLFLLAVDISLDLFFYHK